LRNLFLKYSIFKKHLIPFYDTDSGLVYPSEIKPSEKFWFNYVKSPGLEKILPDLTEEYAELSNSLSLVPGSKYGLHVRDSEYKKFQSQQRGMSKLQADFYGQRSMHRDSDITNFMQSVKELELLKYQGIRFGSKVKRYSSDFLKPLVNYAESNFQTPKNDIVLLKEIDFLICGFSGLTELGRWLRKPIFLIDVGEFQIFSRRLEIISSIKIILPKVVCDKVTGKLLTLDEIKELRTIGMSTREFNKFINHNSCPIYLKNNTSQVIAKSILLAENLLTERTLDENINLGKEAFQKLYGTLDFELSPVLSPFWPNLFLRS
jgi:putative glycosyltransferase (TIGR04372 family)